MTIFIIIILFLVLLTFSITFSFTKKRKLKDADKINFSKKLENIKKLSSVKEKIIDLDKLYHHILLALWYKWTFWDILKQNPNSIKDIQKIWELHKLRNKLAHDFLVIDEAILSKKVREYELEIKIFL